MVRIEIVEKCRSWLGFNSLFQSTLASVMSLNNSFCSIFKVKPSYSEYSNKCTGVFGFERLKEPKGFDLVLKDSVRKAENLMEEMRKENHDLNPEMVFDEILDLFRVKRLVEFVMLTHPEKKFVDAAEQVHFKVSQCIDKLFYKCYNFFEEAMKDKRPVVGKEPVNPYFLRMFLHSIRTDEVILDEERTSSFAKPASLPSKRRRRRKWWQLSSDIEPSAWFKMLNGRLSNAYRFHCDTYPDFALSETIACSRDFVLMFLEDLKKKLKPEVSEDLRKLYKENHSKYTWSARNISLLIKESKEKILGIDSCVEDYFSLDTCMDGLELILRSLYDVILEVVDDRDIINGELWHDDVKKYCVREGNEILGYIYCDFFARPCKTFTNTFLIQSGKICENGTHQIPIVIISLSLPNPGISQPLLLNPHEVYDLFSAMGHAVHCIFGQTEYQLIRGTRCGYDISRVSAYFMLFFASDPRVLQKFAKHYQTREAIPNDLIDKLSKYRKVFSVYNMQLMTFNAAFDQACHSHLFPYYSFPEIFGQVWNQHFGSYRKITLVEMYTFARFIYRRRAQDCSYLMSLAVATLIWRKYFKDDPLSQLAGKRYRKKFLARSGLKPAQVLVEKYLKRDLTPECLSNALMKNVKPNLSNIDISFHML